VNSSGSSGGGLRDNGDLNITDSTISFNTSEDGGGISNPFPYTMTLAQSTVMENVASDDGGGIWNGGEVTIHNSTVSSNLAGDEGGGIYSTESVDVRNSTLFGNSAAQGSAVSNREDAFVGNTIVGGTCAGTDILLSLGGNIESPGDTCGLSHASDQLAVTTKDLSLGPLSDNGGHTLTHAPLYPSAAIDTGINGPCLPQDQREVQRPKDGDGDGFADCDVGSIESEDLIFADGLESGDTSAWSSTVE
jgi:predicted outer membrane repeat protein